MSVGYRSEKCMSSYTTKTNIILILIERGMKKGSVINVSFCSYAVLHAYGFILSVIMYKIQGLWHAGSYIELIYYIPFLH